MEDTLKPYPKYKEIDLPWLNAIPYHWKLLRNKNFLFDEKEVVGGNSHSYKLLSLTKQGVIYRDVESGKGKFPKEFNSYKIVKENSLILCLFDIDETPRTVGLSKHEGMITGAYDVFLIKDA
ncbi:MAG: restriction endonuclease subunit S, partial [Bacteroidia bacterium]|nr:restriction endonuclease subunit S [Bacteroidia bacterium]